ITNRYSPGYCNWSLQEQQKLFHLLGDKPVNVTLSSSCLMQPIKSVSGIIGVGRNVKEKAYGCTVCNNKDCIYRKILEKSSETELQR
ncbi:MAG: hypothetical protein LBV74_06355, partial [Tannerella sp.]|nr:hypothetical protein [Tannerella sp.]